MKLTPQRLRLPLQLALCVSPLFLLVPQVVHTKDFSRRDLLLVSNDFCKFLPADFKHLQTWIAFGNQAPEIVRRVELLLWQAILRVAHGQQDVARSMADFLEAMPWSELQKLGDAEREWFSTKGTRMRFILIPFCPYRIVEVEASADPYVKQIQIEGNLPAGWPLVSSVRADRRSLSPEHGVFVSGEGACAQIGAPLRLSNWGSPILREPITSEGATATRSHDGMDIDTANGSDDRGNADAGACAQAGVPPLPLGGSSALGGSFVLDEAAAARTGGGTDVTMGGNVSPSRSETSTWHIPASLQSIPMVIYHDHDLGEEGGSLDSKKRKTRPDNGSSDEACDSGSRLENSRPDGDDGSSLSHKKRKTRYNADASGEGDGNNRPDGEPEDPLGKEGLARLSVDSSDEEDDNSSSDSEFKDEYPLGKERKARSDMNSTDVEQHNDGRSSRGTKKAKKNRKRNPRRPVEAQASRLKLHKNLRDEGVEPGDSIWCPIFISVCISGGLCSNSAHCEHGIGRRSPT